MTKREFLTASVGLGFSGVCAAFAQEATAAQPRTGRGRGAPIPVREAKTTKLFKSPDGLPNGIAVTPDGLWIGEQKLSGQSAVSYRLPEPKSLTEEAWLVDWHGKLLKTVATPSRNTSGMAAGGGYVWMCANAAPKGVFQVDMNSKLISHRQIPLGTDSDGGGCHGALWNEASFGS
jgi:sugar lactone lactonase YvrE